MLNCNECEESFKSETHLKTHVGRKHLVSRDVPCPVCAKMFYDERDLKDHDIQVHRVERKFKCDECP